MSKLPYLYVFSIMFFTCQPVWAVDAKNFDDLDQQIYIGQAYPSGNVYVRRFVEGFESTAAWPKRIKLHPVGTDLKGNNFAVFVKTLKSRVIGNIVHSVYIPGDEGMDENHNSCGSGKIQKNNPAYTQLSGDFFNTVVDHCETNEGVAVYRVEPSKYSYMVIAADKEFVLAGTGVIADTIRPLIPLEAREVEKNKQEMTSRLAVDECTTIPAFIDAAKILYEAGIGKTKFKLRLSSYATPGCGGHLTAVYVLDIVDTVPDYSLINTFSIYQYQGLM